MNLLGIGDLVLDFYYGKDNDLVKVSLGGSVFNSVSMVGSNQGINKLLLLTYGADVKGEFNKHCMLHNINCFYSIQAGLHNKTFPISLVNGDLSSLRNNANYSNMIIDIELFKKVLGAEGVDCIALETLKDEYINIAKYCKLNNIKVFADISYPCITKRLSDIELAKYLKGTFDYLQVNNFMYDHISKRIGAKNELEFREILDVEVLSITYSNRHVFVIDNQVLKFKIREFIAPVDTTGAGDAFFSVFLERLIISNFSYNEKFLEEIVIDSRSRVNSVLHKIGIF